MQEPDGFSAEPPTQPGLSISAPVTSPPVPDSKVAIFSPRERPASSTRVAVARISSSFRQAHGRGRHGGDAFAAPSEAEPLAGGRLDADAVDFDARDRGDARAHGIAVRPDAGRLAHDREV